jgi:hypothetical protein
MFSFRIISLTPSWPAGAPFARKKDKISKSPKRQASARQIATKVAFYLAVAVLSKELDLTTFTLIYDHGRG